MRTLSLVNENPLSEHVLFTAWQPRMPPSDRVLHIQAGMQDKVYGARLRCMHGRFRLSATRRSHESTVLVRAWRPLARNPQSGRHTQAGPLQGAATVRSHVRPVVVRSAGRLWQRKKQ